MAEGTQRTRLVQWRFYEKFCALYRFPCTPATAHNICLYIAYMDSKGFEYSSVLNYVHSLASLHNYHNLPSPPIKHFSVNQALTGLRKNREDRPNKKLPITVELLHKIHESLHCIPSRFRLAFWSACLVAFFTLLRRSNLFSCKAKNCNLKIKDIVIVEDQLYVRAQQIKTNKFEPISVNLPLPLIQGSPLCPTSTIKKQLAAMPGRSNASLFAYQSKSGKIKPLTASRFTKYLRLVLSESNCPSLQYSIHSFRRGGATLASALHIPTSALKAQGQWRSSCYQQYISRDAEHRLRFVQLMSSALQVRPDGC